jgi:hypothetical protein
MPRPAQPRFAKRRCSRRPRSSLRADPLAVPPMPGTTSGIHSRWPGSAFRMSDWELPRDSSGSARSVNTSEQKPVIAPSSDSRAWDNGSSTQNERSSAHHGKELEISRNDKAIIGANACSQRLRCDATACLRVQRGDQRDPSRRCTIRYYSRK